MKRNIIWHDTAHGSHTSFFDGEFYEESTHIPTRLFLQFPRQLSGYVIELLEKNNIPLETVDILCIQNEQ